MLMLRALRTRGTPQPVRRRETILPSHGTRRRRRVARFRITIQPRSARRRKALVRRCRSAEGARVGAWAREERSPAAKDRIDRKIHSQRSNSCSPRRTPRLRRANSHELAAPINWPMWGPAGLTWRPDPRTLRGGPWPMADVVAKGGIGRLRVPRGASGTRYVSMRGLIGSRRVPSK